MGLALKKREGWHSGLPAFAGVCVVSLRASHQQRGETLICACFPHPHTKAQK